MGKYTKCAVDTPKKNPEFPSYRIKNDPKVVRPIVQVDADTVPGAEFYSETRWIMPVHSNKEIKLCEEHTHDFTEVLGFFGYSYDNIQDLGAELEIWIDGEKNIVDRSFSACIPAGVKHGPVIIRNHSLPIFHVSSGNTPKYE
jgi:hypothetical protein